MTASSASSRSWPFTVAPEVAALAGEQELQILADMAAEPYGCAVCRTEAHASAATTCAVIFRTRTPTRAPDGRTVPSDHPLYLLRLAHASCSPSTVIDLVDEAGVAVTAASTVEVAAWLLAPSRRGWTRTAGRPLLLLSFASSFASARQEQGPDGRSDLLVGGLLQAGMSLVGDVAVEPPPAPELLVVLTTRPRSSVVSVTVMASEDQRIVEEVELETPKGWSRALAEHRDQLTVLAGSALPLTGGLEGLDAVARSGRLAGALISTLRR